MTKKFLLLLAMFLMSVYFSVRFGAADLDWSMIEAIRLPRVVLAIAVGMGLSISGLILQSLFSNPLCEPYTIGISSGAALGAVIGFQLFPESIGMALSSFFGAALFGILLVFVAMRVALGSSSLLLFGVMLGFLGSSLVALSLVLMDPMGINAVVFWLMGDLSKAENPSAVFILISVIVLSAVVWTRWKALDGLLFGELSATSLGIDVARERVWLLALSALLVSLCVSWAGMIGFVGLIVPHLCRKFVGSRHQLLIPASGLLGGTVLVMADLLARTLIVPIEMPVGVVTALIGAPLFMFVLFRERGM